MGATPTPSTAGVDAAEAVALAAARARVLERIGLAARGAGRDPATVCLVAVSKTVAATRLRAAVAAGLDVVGENRVQEAVAKIGEVPGATWHLVGPLQSNKARRAVEAFAVIQTVDSIDLAPIRSTIGAVEMGGQPLSTFQHPPCAIYLLGSEANGLPAAILEKCNATVSLQAIERPSYNVAVAGSIVLYHRVFLQSRM